MIAIDEDEDETQAYEVNTQVLTTTLMELSPPCRAAGKAVPEKVVGVPTSSVKPVVVEATGSPAAPLEAAVSPPRATDSQVKAVGNPDRLPSLAATEIEDSPVSAAVAPTKPVLGSPTSTSTLPYQTPSPRTMPVLEISPVKVSLTRDSQLGLKGKKAAELEKKRKPAKETKDMTSSPRTTKSISGTKNKNLKKLKSFKKKKSLKTKNNKKRAAVDESPPVSKSANKTVEDVKRPTKSRSKTAKDSSPCKNKKKRAAVDESTPVSKSAKKTVEDVKQPTKSSSKTARDSSPCEAPAKRCRTKTGSPAKTSPSSSPKPLVIKAVTPKVKPATFARRYRPPKDSWMQRLWDAGSEFFEVMIAPRMRPGQKTALEARLEHVRLDMKAL